MEEKIGTCGCDDKALQHVEVTGKYIDPPLRFKYCSDCIKADRDNGFKVTVLTPTDKQ